MKPKTKVLAYITQEERLLVFREPDFPEAGVQVPGGTVEEEKSLETAVLREAREETGLTDLTVAAYLGVEEWEQVGQRTRRQGFHLICGQATPLLPSSFLLLYLYHSPLAAH